MGKRDALWASLVFLLGLLVVKPHLETGEIIRKVITFTTPVATKINAYSIQYFEMRRLVLYRAITLFGLLETRNLDVAKAFEGYMPFEGPQRVWCFIEFALMSLAAICAGLMTLVALKILCVYIYTRIDWVGLWRLLRSTIVFGTAIGCSTISPEIGVFLLAFYGLKYARRFHSEYCPHPVPMLEGIVPDTRGILVVDEPLLPPFRNVGGLEMAIPGVKTNKTTLASVPFSFLICSTNWESVIGMGFRIEIDGKDVLVTVLHVHNGWKKRYGAEGYMYIFGKNGRARFKPKVAVVSRALDLVYYEYPKEIGSAGIVKGKHILNRGDGVPIWVLSPPTGQDGLIESSCATMRSYAPYHLIHWANTRPGSSGSPIYTKDGIIGVHRGSDGVNSNYGVLLFTKPKFPQETLETSPAVLKHYDLEDSEVDDTKKKAMEEFYKRVQGETWADDYEEEQPYYGYGESTFPSKSGCGDDYLPPGMNPVIKKPWFLDVSYHGELLIYPVGFNGNRTIGRPYNGKENLCPAQSSSPASGITVGSTKTGNSSSPSSATTQVQESNMVPPESGKPRSDLPLSALTLAIERMQKTMVQELRALKEQQPCVQSSTDGASLIGQLQPSEPPSSIKPSISKKALKRAKKLSSSSLNGSLSATQVAIDQTSATTSKTGAG